MDAVLTGPPYHRTQPKKKESCKWARQSWARSFPWTGSSPTADQNADGLINTTEGAPFYGPIAVSFTTFGDTSPASGLAVDRFPVASSVGTVNYFRSLVAPPRVAFNLGNFAIVQHGVDLNGNGEYDFDAAGASDLDPSLPQEATIPATCGVINPA